MASGRVYGPPTVIATTAAPARILLGDATGDDALDLLVLNDSEFEPLEGDGSGGFATQILSSEAGGDFDAFLDFDGSGLADLALYDSSSGTISIIVDVILPP